MDRPEWIGATLARVDRVTRTVRERPAVAVGVAALALLVVIWIIWAIHVGSTNGGRAAVGVLITWPLIFLVASGLGLIGLAGVRMARRLQPSDGPGTATEPEVEAESKEDEPEDADEDEDESKSEGEVDPEAKEKDSQPG